MPTFTEVVHEELGRVPVARGCCRRAEIATMLRLSAVLGRRDGRLVVVADLDEVAAARRLHALLKTVVGSAVRLQPLPAPGPGQRGRHRISVDPVGGAQLARRVGLLDGHGRLVSGLPRQVIRGPVCDAAAVWRAALLTSGGGTGSGQPAALQVHPPDQLVALALVGAARRLGVTARSAEMRGRWQVAVRDDPQAVALLERIGAAEAARRFQHRAPAQPACRPDLAPGFDTANRQRAAVAGVTAAARVRAALTLLGDDAPAHLLDIGRLRLAHPHARLEELGARADPPMNKNAVAGRIRRLIARAADRAAATGQPPTQTALPAADPHDPSPTSWPATPAATTGCA